MKTWIAYILQHHNIAEDFTLDMEERSNSLLLLQNKAILASDFDKAAFLAHEAEVYRRLGQMIRKELREMAQQLEHEQTT